MLETKKYVYGLNRKYDEEPINICESLNKRVKDGNYFCVIDAEDRGYYIVRLKWAIENEFLYRIYF